MLHLNGMRLNLPQVDLLSTACILPHVIRQGATHPPNPPNHCQIDLAENFFASIDHRNEHHPKTARVSVVQQKVALAVEEPIQGGIDANQRELRLGRTIKQEYLRRSLKNTILSLMSI